MPNSASDRHRFFLASMGEHSAHGLLGFMIVVALILLTLLIWSIRWLARRLHAARLEFPRG